jgi:hypothetical protein
MVTLPEVADDVLNEMTAEYEQAKTQAASYRREKKRLESEVDSLRANLAAGVMSADQLNWMDTQIRQRLARIKELADLESQPVGAAVGRPRPGKEAIETVRELLETLDETWGEKPNGLKNTLMRLLLKQIIIWPGPAKIRVRLVWQFGPPRELVIHRPRVGKRARWTERELSIVKEHYETADIDELVEMIPGRTWEGIREVGRRLGLSRATKKGGRGHRGKDRPYTPEEDKLIRRYYAGKIGIDEVKSTGRTIIGIRARAGKLGLTRQTGQVTWEWADDEDHISQEEHLPTPVLLVCRFRAGIPELEA